MSIISRIALDWAIRCFGPEHVFDNAVRSLRCAEEAIELAQACGVDKLKVHRLVELIYSKPRGDWRRELGGVMMTATVMAAANEHEASELLEIEVRRVLKKTPEHFAERNKAKIDAGLD